MAVPASGAEITRPAGCSAVADAATGVIGTVVASFERSVDDEFEQPLTTTSAATAAATSEAPRIRRRRVDGRGWGPAASTRMGSILSDAVSAPFGRAATPTVLAPAQNRHRCQ
ncbi:hypothetical protein GCM10027169_39220 [Gordonia jinhuaensis]